MQIMWSPWRSEYIDSFKNEESKQPDKTFFKIAIENPDKDSELLVVKRYEKCFIILNKYPYNNGHLLVAPYREISDVEELTDEEYSAIWLTIRKAVKALKIVFKPHGFNIGCNIGRVAGAGVPQHIHFHVVPRWNGDSNFMAVTGNANVISESLNTTRNKLAEVINQLENTK